MSVAIPLSAYTWRDSSNSMWPICNTKFAYGTLGPTENVKNTSNNNYYTCSDLSFGSLNVVSVSQGNNNLIGLIPFTDASGIARQTISANQNGIYRIRTTFSFTGTGFTNPTYISVWFSESNYNNNAVNYNNIVPIDPSANQIISDLSTNQFLSFGYLYANSSSYTNLNSSTSYGYGYKPYFSINSGYISSSVLANNGLSVVEEILYLQAYKPLFFNIQCNTPIYLNATGNFTLELLSFLPPILTGITNAVDISYSAVQFSNEYNYIEFYPTTASGTATITFSSNINLNYLLVGGGGGGGGGYYQTFSGGTSVIGGGGGGGGGSAINGSVSASSFNIYVGNFGVSGYGNSPGQNGYESSIGKTSSNSNIAIAYGGGGGGSYSSGTSAGGGVWNTVLDPSGNGTKYLAVNGGYGANFNQENSNGSNGYTIILPFKTYYMEGAGGGGGEFNQSTSYGGGNNIGGSYSGSTHQQGSTTIAGFGYGTGGGGGTPTGISTPGQTYNSSGGNGGHGLIVLYWK
jgi:hypothetical protein